MCVFWHTWGCVYGELNPAGKAGEVGFRRRRGSCSYIPLFETGNQSTGTGDT